MKITIAPDSFKGCLSAAEVCAAIAAGIAESDPTAECLAVPMADGGEGTVEALVAATDGQLCEATVSGPLGTPIAAVYGLLGDGRTAVIEVAAAAGLSLVPPEQRNPLRTTTFGLGELIRAALEAGARDFIIGLGGSATNDAGLGMAAALGARLLDAQGAPVSPTGAGLRALAAIDMSAFDKRVREARFRVACDVDNPLYGPQGAAYVYGPQKGATPEIVAELDAGLRQFAAVVARDLGVQVACLPGAGAAGGLGAGLVAFCGATLEPGVGIVAEATGLREKMRDAVLCITGEGRLDGQTVRGKTAWGVAEIAAERGVPCVALAGALAPGPEWTERFAAVFSICTEPLSLEEAMTPEGTRQRLRFVAAQLWRCFQAGCRAVQSEEAEKNEGRDVNCAVCQ